MKTVVTAFMFHILTTVFRLTLPQ